MDWLLITWKSDLPDKIKRDFFKAVAVLVPLYGCTNLSTKKNMHKAS